MVDAAELIVVVRPADPPHRVEHVAITPKGKRRNREKWPDFDFAVQRFEVVEVIADDRPTPRALPKILEVVAADVDAQLHLHRRYYLEGLSKSPIFRRYTPTGTSTAAPERIALLTERASTTSLAHGRLAFVVDGALETVDVRPAIEQALAARAARGGATLPPPIVPEGTKRRR